MFPALPGERRKLMSYFEEEKINQRKMIIPTETLQKLFPYELALMLYKGEFNDILKELN